MGEIIVKMDQIATSDSGIPILKGVDFSLMSGEIHALVGENGAGKSTLMRVLYGLCQFYTGSIYISGKKREIHSIQDAQASGIGYVPQQIHLVPHLTIAENILLGREPLNGFNMLNKRAQIRMVERILEEHHLKLKAQTPVSKLSLEEQQIVQILKAIREDVNILILDEATTALQESYVQWAYQLIGELKAKGIGIIYITHRLQELPKLADRVTILRDGKNIKTLKIPDVTNDGLIRLMIGNNLKSHYVRDFHLPGDTFLEVRGLCSCNFLQDISFSVRKGEIVGLVGRSGSGRSLLAQCLFGLTKYDSGEIRIGDEHLHIRFPQDALNAHIALLPEQRNRQGLFDNCSVEFNMTFKAMDDFFNGIRLNTKREKAIYQYYIQKLGIKSSSENCRINTLSGGNQQKVVLAKWLATNPKLLILDKPTQGMDVISKSEIYRILDQLVENGVAILMVPSDISEAINICDRILIISEGRLGVCLEKGKFSQTLIAKLVAGVP